MQSSACPIRGMQEFCHRLQVGQDVGSPNGILEVLLASASLFVACHIIQACMVATPSHYRRWLPTTCKPFESRNIPDIRLCRVRSGGGFPKHPSTTVMWTRGFDIGTHVSKRLGQVLLEDNWTLRDCIDVLTLKASQNCKVLG